MAFQSSLFRFLLVSLALACWAPACVRGWIPEKKEDLEPQLIAARSTPVPVKWFVSRLVSRVVPAKPGPTSGMGQDVVIAADGSGQFRTVQEGIDAAPPGSPHQRTIVHIRPGRYNEKVVVPSEKTFMKIIGSSKVYIYYDKAAADYDAVTAMSATFAVLADDFEVVGLTIENTFGWPNHRNQSQAVALLALADRVAFYDCTFLGKQDTLFAHTGRQYYRNCYIEGSVDFIFGNARAVFEGCSMHVVNNDNNCFTALAAHGRQSAYEDTGFLFSGGFITGHLPCASARTWLGRTWGPHCTIIFWGVDIDNITNPLGWTIMSHADHVNTSFVAGVGNYGEGASTSGWVPWARTELSQAEEAHYLGLQFIDGFSWLQEFDIPEIPLTLLWVSQWTYILFISLPIVLSFVLYVFVR